MEDEKLKELVEKYIDIYNKLHRITMLYYELSDEEKEKSKLKKTSKHYISIQIIVKHADLGKALKTYNLDLEDMTYRAEINEDEIPYTGDFSESMDLLLEYKEILKQLNDYITSLEKIPKETENNDFLDYTLTGNHKEEVFDTSVLDNYRNWGIQRIALDGFQNHLKGDSKGTKSFLQFYIDDRWVDYEEALSQKDKITQIRFADNGVGFDKNNLRFLSSQKTSEDFSAGQFGEGLKLIAMASVNLGLDLEVQSKNWTARATGKPVEYSNFRNTELGETTEKRNQLVWEVSEYDAEPIQGARTIFHNPTPEFIEYVLNLPEYILEISDKKPIFEIHDEELIDIDKGGMLYSKGIFVKNTNSIFSYNFNDKKLNPDRNDFVDCNENYVISSFISSIDNYRIVKSILSRLIDDYEKSFKEGDFKKDNLPIEFRAAKYLMDNLKNEDEGEYIGFLWKKAFEEIFTEKDKDSSFKGTVLKTDFKVPESVARELEKYRLISLPKEWIEFLGAVGVKTDKDVIPEYTEEKIQTSLTSNYGSELWDTQRIVLDACQNHLSTDSGGTNIFIRFQTKDGTWHDYRDFKEFSDEDITKIKISDDGIGYDSKSLGLFASVKGSEESSGKWGEGLKMIAASAVRNGLEMQLRSRDWMAIPFLTDELLNEGKENEKKVERLNFLVKTITNKENNVLKDNDNPENDKYGFDKKKEQSSTTFINPTPELIEYFRNIKDSILIFSDEKPMVSLEDVDVLSMVGGKLYIKNILIPGDHQLRYTYHLKDFDIETRDREDIKKASMKEQIEDVLENVDNEQFIKMFLMEAAMLSKEGTNNKFLEFETNFYIPTKTEQADLWIRSFQEYFGENSCVRNISNQDYDEVAKAQHMGFRTITLPDTIVNALSSIEGRDGKKIPTYENALNEAIENAVFFSEDELDNKDKAMIKQLYKYNDVLALNSDSKNKITQINVYGYDPEYTGKRAAGFAHYGNTININIDVLREGLEPALDVFFHEAGHAETGANDVDSQFRDFHTRTLAELASRVLPIDKSVIDNGIVGQTRWSKFKKYCSNLYKNLFWKKVTKGDKLDFGENEKSKKGDER